MEPSAIEDAQRLALKQLTNATETTIDGFLKEHPALLAGCMNFTMFGHHGSWVVPQQLIRPPSLDEIRGLKPDYLVGGKGSRGYSWFVVELKSPKDKLFTREKSGTISLSSVANRGICQLLRYIDYCSSAQSYLRDSLRLKEFREPKGFLIIGREAELSGDRDVQELSSAFNRMTVGSIEIRTFDALVRSNTGTWVNEGVIVQEDY
ncbi:MAG TPA: Shedu anti-phage system protein SduA domain-containing protein [Pyrinomonadaceae bacterium]|nr:Shedu anti-phage system protein SduA domain-containing protein [Pyrinomonadaceae bacterium]